MLYEFVTTHHDAIIERARTKLSARSWAPASARDLEHGVPIFLARLSDMLQSELPNPPVPCRASGTAATPHGRELLALGFTASQIVHNYGDIRQAVTEVAVDQHAPITAEEFTALNGWIDTAIAEAVTAQASLAAAARSRDAIEQVSSAAHESRDLAHTAILAYLALKRGAVGIHGSTGAVLARSLVALRDLADSTLAVVRIAANQQRRERVLVAPLLQGLADAGALHAESRQLGFALEPGHPQWVVRADPQLLTAAVTNLLSIALTSTRPGGQVVLRARAPAGERLQIEVEDECGGMSPGGDDSAAPSAARRRHHRAGWGLALSMARKAVTAHDGAVYVRNLPGKGCVSTIDMPLVLNGGPEPSNGAP